MFGNAAVVTPLRSMSFGPGPNMPETKTPVIAPQAVTPGFGLASLTFTSPPTHVITMSSAALLVTCSDPPANTFAVTTAPAGEATSRIAARARRPRTVCRIPRRRAIGTSLTAVGSVLAPFRTNLKVRPRAAYAGRREERPPRPDAAPAADCFGRLRR